MASSSRYGDNLSLRPCSLYPPQLSVASTNSNESLRTQVPLPYHLPQAYEQQQQYGQNLGFGGQIEYYRPASVASSTFNIPYAPSPIYSQVGRSTLNPASPAWIPTSERQNYQDETGSVHNSVHGVQPLMMHQDIHAPGDQRVRGAHSGNLLNEPHHAGFHNAVGPHSGFNEDHAGVHNALGPNNGFSEDQMRNRGYFQRYATSQYGLRSSPAPSVYSNYHNAGFAQHQQLHDVQQPFSSGSSYAGSVASEPSGFGVMAPGFSLGHHNNGFTGNLASDFHSFAPNPNLMPSNQFQGSSPSMNNLDLRQSGFIDANMKHMTEGHFGQAGDMRLGMTMNQGQFQGTMMPGTNINQDFDRLGNTANMNANLMNMSLGVDRFDGVIQKGMNTINTGHTRRGPGRNTSFAGRGRRRPGSGSSSIASSKGGRPGSAASGRGMGRGLNRGNSNKSRTGHIQSSKNLIHAQQAPANDLRHQPDPQPPLEVSNIQQTPVQVRTQQTVDKTPSTVVKHKDEGLLEQTPQGRDLANEPFTSEPRLIEHVQPLRSRRNQSVANINTGKISSWYSLSPAPVGSSSRARVASIDEQYQLSPPKMLTNGPTTLSIAQVKSDEQAQIPHEPLEGSAAGEPKGKEVAPSSGTLVSTSVPGGLLRRGGMSTQLRILTNEGTTMPGADEALTMSTLPFAETARLAKPATHGVIQINNIPYNVKRSEILALLGRNARIVNETECEPVHIIMERVTSKTLDCFVEFESLAEAVNCVNYFEKRRMDDHPPKLGTRHVDIEVSSQEQLMKALFPKAKNVEWRGAQAIIHPNNPHDPYNSGFQGFLSREEVVLLTKHVESPQRSPFAKDCPQRPFETLLDTLQKFPWYMVNNITIKDVRDLHGLTVRLLKVLSQRVREKKDEANLTSMLLKRVSQAALKCHGFSPCMKDDIVYVCEVSQNRAMELGLPPFADWWSPFWCIGPKPDCPHDLLNWYINRLRLAAADDGHLSLAEKAAQGGVERINRLFGKTGNFIYYPADLASSTLAEIAASEWNGIEFLLRKALGTAPRSMLAITN